VHPSPSFPTTASPLPINAPTPWPTPQPLHAGELSAGRCNSHYAHPRRAKQSRLGHRPQSLRRTSPTYLSSHASVLSASPRADHANHTVWSPLSVARVGRCPPWMYLALRWRERIEPSSSTQRLLESFIDLHDHALNLPTIHNLPHRRSYSSVICKPWP
jgi:hypothetical protein